jgi:hypothetical protein
MPQYGIHLLSMRSGLHDSFEGACNSNTPKKLRFQKHFFGVEDNVPQREFGIDSHAPSSQAKKDKKNVLALGKLMHRLKPALIDTLRSVISPRVYYA